MQPLGRQSAARWTPIVAGIVALACGASAYSQQFLIGGPAEFELTAPQVDVVSSATRARLEQARALAADQEFSEAVEILRELVLDDGRKGDSGKVVSLDVGTYVNLPAYCQLELSHLPPEGLAEYRRQVDDAAEQRYRAALAARDSDGLERVVDESFCSSWGDDALLAAGELALERGDYAAARRAWLAISPLVVDPQGRSAWFALHNIDLSRQWSKVNARWQNRPAPPGWLAYPDTTIELAAVRARLVLASIREGDFDRAALELEVFRRLHSQSAGRLAGQVGPYAAALERLLKSARDWPAAESDADWPTFARVPTRNAVAPLLGEVDAPQWPQPVSLGDRPVKNPPQPPVRESALPLRWHPVVVGGQAFVHDSRSVRAYDLATGEPAVTADGVIYGVNDPDGASAGDMPIELGGAVAAGGPCYTLTAAGGLLYARLGGNVTRRLQPTQSRNDERLVGIDLAREGLLVFEAKPDDSAWSFDGAPVADDRRVYVAMRHSDIEPGSYVAAFDTATGRRLWRTFLAAADTPATGRGDETTHNLLTLSGDRLFVNTNLGVVAAVSTRDGRIAWLRRYDRAAGRLSLPGPIHFDRDPSPCVYHQGLVFVAPTDSPQVFALDADNGQTIWANDRLAGVVHLIGVAHGRLIASGNQLWALEARSGRVRFVWPESEHAGVRGFGRGLVAGQEMFWPTRDRIYAFNVTTGRQSREPIDITALGSTGANLVAAEGQLLVVGQDRMMLLGPQPQPKPRGEEADAAETVAMVE